MFANVREFSFECLRCVMILKKFMCLELQISAGLSYMANTCIDESFLLVRLFCALLIILVLLTIFKPSHCFSLDQGFSIPPCIQLYSRPPPAHNNSKFLPNKIFQSPILTINLYFFCAHFFIFFISHPEALLEVR